MKYLTLTLLLLSTSLYSDTFELRGQNEVNLEVKSGEKSSFYTLQENQVEYIDNYIEVCVDKKINNKSYVLVNNSSSLNQNILCYNKPKVKTSKSMSIAEYLKKISNKDIPKFINGLTFAKKDLRIKKYAEGKGVDDVSLTIKKSEIDSFSFDVPNGYKTVLWGDSIEVQDLTTGMLDLSTLNVGTYGLDIEEDGKKIMGFEIQVVE